MEDPILVTMKTSDTTERPCVEETSGSNRRFGRGSWLTTSVQGTGGALTDRMMVETLYVRADTHCICDLHMHMDSYDSAEVVLTLFRSIRF